MRHKKSYNHLGRKSAHRKAMLSNMSASLIKHKRIETTTAKAKALKPYVEPLITRSKDDTTHNRRVVFSYLQNKEAVSILFQDISVKVADRPGGYTRIIKLGNRQGDNADMCLIELVDYNDIYLSEKQAKKAKSSRRGGGKNTRKSSGDSSAQVDTLERTPVEYDNELIDTQYTGDHQPESLKYYEDKVRKYKESLDMEAIEMIGTHEYDCDVGISINSEDEEHLIFGKEYTFDINLTIKDPLNREALLNTFSVYLITNHFDLDSHDVFHKFKFKEEKTASCQLQLIPDKLGDAVIKLDFYQNSKRFSREKFNLKIIP